MFQEEGEDDVYRYSEDPHKRGMLIDRAHSIQLECATDKLYFVMSFREVYLVGSVETATVERKCGRTIPFLETIERAVDYSLVIVIWILAEQIGRWKGVDARRKGTPWRRGIARSYRREWARGRDVR